jgi:hypothetical protein
VRAVHGFLRTLRTIGEGLEGPFGSEATPKKALGFFESEPVNRRVASSSLARGATSLFPVNQLAAAFCSPPSVCG